jgi:hypothetical protein
MRIGIRVRHGVLGAAIAACANGGGGLVDDSTFVVTMARLHAIERDHQLSDVVRDSLRRRVLQEQGLTVAVLERQAREYARDPGHASAIWREINQKTATVGSDPSAGDLNPPLKKMPQ